MKEESTYLQKPRLLKSIDEDFDYDISSKSESEIRNLANQINENVATYIANIGKEIEDQFYVREKQFNAVYRLHSEIRFANNIILDVRKDLKKLKDNHEIIFEITEKLNPINIQISTQNLLDIRKNVQYLKFLKERTGQETINSLKWAENLSDVLEYLNNSDIWYTFLNNLFNILSEYEIQKDTKRYVTIKENLKSYIEVNKNNVKKIKMSLKEFLKQVMQLDSDGEYRKIKHVKLDEPKLKSLNKLLDFTLEDNAVISCNDETHGLIAQGKYVKLSEITDKSCPFQPQLIELHALEKVFIDASLNKTGEKVQLFIISPTWDIIGTPKIVLDGKSGDTHDTVKARDGLGPGQDGKDGRAGNPGGSAGHFIGIGIHFINGKNLEIYANGGNGGPGENGGDGIAGKNAVGPDLPEGTFICSSKSCEDYIKTYNFDCKYKHTTKQRDYGFTNSYIFRHYFILSSRVSSDDMLRGGNGGHGGSSGKGGKAGKVMLFELLKDSGIKVYNNTGKIGEMGIGGSGKEGGLYGKLVHVSCQDIYKHWKIDETYGPISHEGGIDGKDGYSDEDKKELEIIPIHNPSFSINKYKYYLRANFANSIKQSYLKTFYNQLENKTQINNLYDTLGLVKDFEGTESQYYKLHNEFSFLPVYQTLLPRIKEYAKNKLSKYVDKRSIAEDKKILDYLYAAALSRICRIKNNFEDNLVVNLNVFIDETVNSINQLEDLKTAVSIDSYQEKFQEVINARTKEAEDYIEAQITPEIQKIIKNVEYQINLLIEETIKLEEEGETKKQELIKEQQKLKNAFILRVALNSLKVTGVFLSFLGPVGAAAGALIGGGAMLAETYGLDNTDSDGSGKIPPLPANLKSSLTKITDHYKDDQRLLSQQIADIEIQLKAFSDKEPSDSIVIIKKHMDVIKNKLDQLKHKTDSTTAGDVRYLRKEMSSLLEKEKNILNDRKKRNEPKIDKKITFVNYAQNLVSLADVSVEFYSKIKQSEVQISKLGKSIQEANEEINLIVNRENEIYKNLIPAWRNLENMIATVEDNLKNKSHIVLDINKWQIQSTLKDIKFQIEKMTSGFKSHDDLMHYLEKLDNSMTFMINLYDRMEYYRDKTELTTYITNVIKGTTVIDDPDKNAAINKLRLAIQSNIVLEKFEIAMNAIRQYIFPFGHFYLSGYNLQEFMMLNETDTLRSNAKTLITELRSQLRISSATTNDYDQYIANNAPFNRRDNQDSTLFVWKHNSNGHIISKLLEGEEITVKADITQGLNGDSIKFNDIGLRFVLPNKTKQRELRKQLDHFKLRMTHLGNNYYKCGDKIYLILNKSHTISYKIAKNSKGKHLQNYLDYDKIHDNCPVFSPYATWKIQLTNISAGFNILAQYKNKPIDLQLVGRGRYIDEGSGACTDDLNNYYTQVSSVSKIIPVKSGNDEVSQDNDDTLDDVGTSEICAANDGHRLARSVDNNDILRQNNKINLTKAYNIPEISFMQNNELQKVPLISNESPNFEAYNTVNNTVNNSLLYNSNNLVLLDLLIRQKSGIKYNQKSNMRIRNDSNLELAQKLAYRGHLHKD